MNVSGTFRYKRFPVPKGKHLSPDLPSQMEDTLWHHFLGGEFSPRGAQEHGPELSFGSPAQEKAFSKMKRQRQGSIERRPDSFRTAVLRVWSVEPLMSLRPFYEIPEVKTTFISSLRYYLTSHYVDICFDVNSSNEDYGSKLHL